MTITIAELVNPPFSYDGSNTFTNVDLTLEQCLAAFLRYNFENYTPKTYAISLQFDDTNAYYTHYLVSPEHSDKLKQNKVVAQEIINNIVVFLQSQPFLKE